jgi:hypothetical protein
MYIYICIYVYIHICMHIFMYIWPRAVAAIPAAERNSARWLIRATEASFKEVAAISDVTNVVFASPGASAGVAGVGGLARANISF